MFRKMLSDIGFRESPVTGDADPASGGTTRKTIIMDFHEFISRNRQFIFGTPATLYDHHPPRLIRLRQMENYQITI